MEKAYKLHVLEDLKIHVFISEFHLGDSNESLNAIIIGAKKHINNQARKPISSLCVYYNLQLIIGYSYCLSHAFPEGLFVEFILIQD